MELLKSGRNQQLRYEFLERWEKFTSFRKWANDHPKTILGVTAGTGFVFLLILFSQFVPPSNTVSELSRKAWFYDLNTDELFTAEIKEISPIEAPSGPLPDGTLAGVKAHLLYYVTD